MKGNIRSNIFRDNDCITDSSETTLDSITVLNICDVYSLSASIFDLNIFEGYGGNTIYIYIF